jgi:hypothetical protein
MKMNLLNPIFAGSTASTRRALRAVGICLLGVASSLLVQESARAKPLPAQTAPILAPQLAQSSSILATSNPTLRCDQPTVDCLRPEPSASFSPARRKWKRRVFVEGTVPVSSETQETTWLEPPSGQRLYPALVLRTENSNRFLISNRQRAP